MLRLVSEDSKAFRLVDNRPIGIARQTRDAVAAVPVAGASASVPPFQTRGGMAVLFTGDGECQGTQGMVHVSVVESVGLVIDHEDEGGALIGGRGTSSRGGRNMSKGRMIDNLKGRRED